MSMYVATTYIPRLGTRLGSFLSTGRFFSVGVVRVVRVFFLATDATRLIRQSMLTR